MNNLLTVTIFTLLIITASCKKIDWQQYYQITKFQITQANYKYISGLMSLKVYNPLPFTVKINSIKFDAYVENYYVGKGEIINQTLKPKEYTLIQNQKVTFFLDYVNPVIEQLTTLDTVPFDIKFHIKMKYFPKPVTFKKTIYLDTKQAILSLLTPANIEKWLTIKTIKLQYLTLKKTNLYFELIFKNQFPVQATIDTIDLNVWDNFGNYLGKIFLTNVNLKPFGKSILPVYLQIDNFSLIGSFLGQFINQNFNITLKGKITLKLKNQSFTIPIEQTIGAKIEFTK